MPYDPVREAARSSPTVDHPTLPFHDGRANGTYNHQEGPSHSSGYSQSYTSAPSALAAEVQRSHFHDNELCLLLHAADDPNSHDVVRRAMRKAIKNRLKKLGLKYDTEVSSMR